MSELMAVSVEHNSGLDSLVNPRFGHTAGFLVVNRANRNAIRYIRNDETKGAVDKAVVLMLLNGIDTVISGAYESSVMQVMKTLGIEAWTAPDGLTAGEAIELYVSGDLKQTTE